MAELIVLQAEPLVLPVGTFAEVKLKNAEIIFHKVITNVTVVCLKPLR